MILTLLGFLSPAHAQDDPTEDPDDTPTLSGPEDPPPFQIDFMPQPAPGQPPAQPQPVDPYPTDPAPFPTDPAPFPTDDDPYPTEPAPYPAPAPNAYSYDTVFLAPLQPYRPELVETALRLDQSMRAALSRQHDLVTIESVPGWPDYTANVYMMSCPEGQYPGCALVCGNRVNAQWTIGGTVSPGQFGHVNVELAFIENAASREVLSFGVALQGNDDRALVEGVSTIFAKILGGAFEQVDLRAVDTDPVERAKLDKAQREILAASLAELEREQGAVSRNEIDRGLLAQPKLTKDDIAQMRVREEQKPWQVLGMSEGEFRRYNNSGKNINEWRELRRGRFGQLVGRLGLGGGVGPYGQAMDGRYTLDDQLQVAQIEQYQYVGQASHIYFDVEAGFGVLPFLDITGHFAFHNAPFEYFINQERVGEPVVINPNDFRRKGLGSWEVGARAAFVPMTVSPVRPAVHAGISYWQGTTWDSFIQGVGNLQPMKAMNVVLFQIGPGVELSAGKNLNVFARGFADVPIAGQRSEGVVAGSGLLQEPADVNAFKLSAPGFSIQAGIVVRIPVLGGADGKHKSTMEFEDEEP